MSQRTLRQWLPGRLTEALRAEWTKLHTLPGTVLLLVGTVALTVSLSAAIDGTLRRIARRPMNFCIRELGP